MGVLPNTIYASEAFLPISLLAKDLLGTTCHSSDTPTQLAILGIPASVKSTEAANLICAASPGPTRLVLERRQAGCPHIRELSSVSVVTVSDQEALPDG
jgi:hypothetical protein